MGHCTLSFFSFFDVVENAVNHRNRLLFGVLNANWGAARWIHGTGIDSFFPLFVSMENCSNKILGKIIFLYLFPTHSSLYYSLPWIW